MKLLDAVSTNGDGATTERLRGIYTYTLACTGVFDGATVTTELYVNDEWVALDDATFTSAGVVKLEGGYYNVRGSVSGAGGSTSVTLALVG